MTKAKRIRKPRVVTLGSSFAFKLSKTDDTLVIFQAGALLWRKLKSKDCRRLAKWLENAALYLEQQEGKE